MKLIGVIGEPATGKTALMRAVLEQLDGRYNKFKFGLLRGRSYPDGLYVLGIYNEGETFAGTDRLSMAVQPYAIKFLKAIEADATIVFEGDRLTREGFLMAVPYESLRLFVLVCSDEEKQRRHKARHDSQPVSFTRSRRTLITRVCERFRVEELVNEHRADIAKNASHIVDAINA